jgi:hypothetical protein
MKKLFILVVAVMATFGLNAQEIQTVDFGSLDPDSKATFQAAAKAHPYGQLIKAEADQVLAIYEVTNVPSRSGKVETQYLYVLEKDGQRRAILLTDKPSKTECVLCWLSQCGGHQGDDPIFEEKQSSGETHIISDSPVNGDEDLVIE